MAGKDAKSLEERLRLGFDCDALCSTEQKKEELRINKVNGMGAFLKEDYSSARQFFINAIPKTGDKQEKEWFYRKIIECSKELFKNLMDNQLEDKAEEEFKRVCAGYEHLIKAFETSDNYLDYMSFVGFEMSDKYDKNLFEEAKKIGEKALCRFPEDHRLYKEMYDLCIYTQDDELEDNCIHTAAKLKFNDADYMLDSFGNALWQRHKDNGIIPFQTIMECRGGALYENPAALQKYGKYMVDNVAGNDKLALHMLYTAYCKKPLMPGLKEDLVDAFEQTMEYMKKNNAPIAERKLFIARYQKILEIRKELAGENEKENEKSADRNRFSSEIVVVNPKEIKQYLDQYVIGQEQAKRGVSVGYYMHLLRLKHQGEKNSKMDKSNILLLGPTGCGKTYMLQILAQMSKVPFVIFDTSKITSAGYVGSDAEDCLKSLVNAAEGDIELAQRGIVYLDEADKIKAKPGYGKDVGGEGAQQQLLKLLEGSIVNVGGHNEKKFQIDTKNILFVVGGAFSYTEEGGSIGDRIQCREKVVGFRMQKDEPEETKTCKEDKKNIVTKLTDKDLHEYGFLPEFIGRLHYRIVLDSLTKPELRRILTEPGNAIIPQYENAFRLSGIKLVIRDDALDTIAEEAFALNAGARSLKTICDKIFEDALFHLPGSSTTEYIVNRTEVMRYIKK
ncbi:MAG: AAA family ATPase [Candidatus Nanoarchaeia archaeon]|nr:AAA family ATPase [Candidatus Nanoarchaeia archaeon]